MKRIALLLASLEISALVALATPQGFETKSIVLYQPSEVLEERLSDTKELNDYIKRLQDVCQQFFADSTSPETLHIVVAVRPGKRSRVWLVSSIQTTPDAKRKALKKNLEKVTPCGVSKGAIAFAIAANVAGGDGKEHNELPMPVEWQKAAAGKRNVVIPDDVLDAVWPRR